MMRMRRRVVITGMGVCAPNGIGLTAFSEAMADGKSGIRFQPELEELGFGCQIAAKPELKGHRPSPSYSCSTHTTHTRHIIHRTRTCTTTRLSATSSRKCHHESAFGAFFPFMYHGIIKVAVQAFDGLRSLSIGKGSEVK